jgi:hypothetical protein
MTRATVTRHWLLQCNPKIWDVWSWWEDDNDLGSWTVAKHLRDIQLGDRFVLWIGGPAAGIYAMGEVRSTSYQDQAADDGYWLTPPQGVVNLVDLAVDQYMFDSPITKASLAARPEFADSLIMRMPGYGNPIPLTPAHWRVISRISRRRTGHPRQPDDDVVVTSRPLGDAPAEIHTTDGARTGVITFPEAKLVKDYAAFLGRELRCLTARLPTGERLVCDAYDEHKKLIIEAKSSTSRTDVRTAIGQVLDYRHHIDRQAKVAILLPGVPAPGLVALLRELGITLIVRDRRGFVVV